MKKGPSFSLYEFKDWMSKQDDLCNFFEVDKTDLEESQHEFIGLQAFAKVGKNKFLKKIVVDTNADDLVEEFFDEGGIITEVTDGNVTIEVSSGTFVIPRFCLKIKKS